MAQSDARFGYTAKHGRTDHNLSQPMGFSCCPGMLLPIWFDLATPGDSYYISHDMPLLRSIQLKAPSMINVKVHYETFFVPMQMIYQPFEQQSFVLNTPQSSFYATNNSLKSNLPLFDYDAYVHALDLMVKDVNVADSFRMADLFGLCPTNFTGIVNSGGSIVDTYFEKCTPSFFPYQILTYHCIYQYYYRLDDKEQFQNVDCNWDRYYNTASVQLPYTDFMAIHQRPWDFDYYTSLYRSPIVTSVNVYQPASYNQYNPLITGNFAPVNDVGQRTTSNDDTKSFTFAQPSTFSTDYVQRSTSTVAIRQMFANEKLAMITGRTKKNYDSQVLAHYGVSVPHDVKHDLTMIHHDMFDLNVQEVTSLADTENSPLGELAGKSYAAGAGKQFKFTAPTHGVIMTIFSIEPKKRYVSAGFDKINAVSTIFDLPTPEFDRLGNVPMFRYESGATINQNADVSQIIGWKERYYQYKRKPAKVTFGYWAANGYNNYGSYFINSMPFGQSHIGKDVGMTSIPDSLAPRPDLGSRFYIERGCLDNQVYMPYFSGWKADAGAENWNYNPWLLYTRDPFIVNSHVKCTKVSWMSKDGEPIYD